MTEISDQAITNDSGWGGLYKMAMGQATRLLFALLLTALAVAAELIPYYLIFQAIQAILISTENLSATFYQLAAWMALALLLKTLFYGLAYYLSHQAAYSILLETRQTLVERLTWASLTWLQQQNSGQLKQSILQDVESIEMFISHHTVEVFAALISPLLVISYLFYIDWHLALAALFCAPVALFSLAFLMRNSAQQYDEFNHVSSDLNSATVEYLRNMPVMKVFCQDTSNFLLMRERLQKYYAVVADLTKKTVPGWSLFSSVLGANILFILPVGIWLYKDSIVSSTQIIMAVILGAGMLKPWLKVSRFFMEANEILAGVRRLLPILDINKPEGKVEHNIIAPVTVDFKEICFFYEDKNTLTDISCQFKPGSFTLLLGPSGSGKSTIAQLLGGLLEPASGSLTINGVSIQDLNHNERCSLIALASQEVFLFKDSIINNICLPKPNASSDEIAKAVQVAQAETLINTLPDGYQTEINEQGVRLSGGEKQRVALARALLVDAPILILDEAMSSLDNLTQRAFYQTLKATYPHKTILVISHHCYGAEDADQIIILNDGKIEDIGQHQDLLSSNNFYQTLYQRQHDTENWSIGGQHKMVTEVLNNA